MKIMKKSVLIWSICLILLNSILILLTTTFKIQDPIVSYVLINIELIIDLYCIYMIINKENIYNLSYINLIAIPTFLIILLSAINLIIPNNLLVVILAILVISYQLIKIIKVSLVVEIISNKDIKIEESTHFIENVRLELDILYEKSKDKNIKTEIKKILEIAKYMNPVENKNLDELKNNILNNLNDLKNNNDDIKKLASINKLNDLLTEYNKRNRR